MKKALILLGLAVVAGAVVLAALLAWNRATTSHPGGEVPPSPEIAASPAVVSADAHPAFLYGRVSILGGAVYEGRLRWGGDDEAFWGDYFYGVKSGNPWAGHVPPERLPSERRPPLEVFGITIRRAASRPADLGRPFMARFGDIARIEAGVADIRVTLKSGTEVVLDRMSANDLDDGVRVWDGSGGVVDLDHRLIRTVELLPAPSAGAAPDRLYGTVHTRQGAFSGFVQWDRRECLGSDMLDGATADGPLSLPFDDIRSIARQPGGGARVALLDGRELELSASGDLGDGNRGIYVDDPRYGRVLVAWEAFERLDLESGGVGPAYTDFPPGEPLEGSVLTRDGRRLAGRLVFDLDESETTETLDAPAGGVDYTIPFGLIAAIVPADPEDRGGGRAGVALHSGEQLALEAGGDLGGGNAGLLVLAAGGERAEYVPWAEVARVELDRPAAMYPPLGP